MGFGFFRWQGAERGSLGQEIVSPYVEDEAFRDVQRFMSQFQAAEVAGVESWQPEKKLASSAPKIEAKAAAVVDFETNELIFAKNIDESLPIASLTKIMTALLALEYGDLEQKIEISKEAAETGEAYMGVEAGEKLRLEELLYGLLLPSGNDAAEAIAQGLAGERAVFIKAMNRKAEMLGLANTLYVNSSGLDEDDGRLSKSSVRDLVLLSHYAWTKFPKFREIVGTKEWEIAATSEHKSYSLKHTLGLEETYPKMKGIKPGNTEAAGYCLVGLAEQKGHEVLVVLLNTPSPKNEVVVLFDWAFNKVKN